MITTAKAEQTSDVSQVSTMSISTRFASMQAELEELRAKAEQISYGGDGKIACNDCGSVGCNCLCDVGCGGFFAGAEAVIVRAHIGDGAENDVVDAAIDARYDYKVTPRIWLGYRNCEGLGIRARWWNFDQDSNLSDAATDPDDEVSFHSLNVQAVDLEATQLVCWGPLQMNFAMGARYGKVEGTGTNIYDFDGDLDVDAGQSDFEGFGPTFALEARRPISCSNFALIGNLRNSLLFGNNNSVDIDADVGNQGFNNVVLDTGERKDTAVYVVESQVGAEYTRCLGSGVLSIRAVMEGQFWGKSIAQNDPGSTSSDNLDEDLGFFGATFGVEYSH